MSALQQQSSVISLEKYEALPEDIRMEVFDGIPYNMAIKVNIYDDLYIDFAEISRLLNL